MLFTPENEYVIKPRDKVVPLTSEQKKEEKEHFKKALAVSIKKARNAKGLKQEDLAVLANLNLSYVGHLERGIYMPTAYVLWKIAKALGVPLKELFDF